MIQVLYKEEKDRFIIGDRHWRPYIRKLIRGEPKKLSGMQRVVANFTKGLNILGIDYVFNPSRWKINYNEPIVCFGLGKLGLEGVKENAKIIAAVGFPYPSDYPELCNRYNVVKFLQHSKWAIDFHKTSKIYPDNIFDTWFAGIDAEYWEVCDSQPEIIHALVYVKTHLDLNHLETVLVQPVIKRLEKLGIKYNIIKYGKYLPHEYKSLLKKSSFLVFISPHETQGFAYLESLSCNRPVFAWNPGFWMDPDKIRLGLKEIKTTSVPFFSDECGDTFKNYHEFDIKIEEFIINLINNKFNPSKYIRDNLTILHSTKRMLEIIRGTR